VQPKSPSHGFLRVPQDGLRAATSRPTAEARTLAAGALGAALLGRRGGAGCVGGAVGVGDWG
jgi:hypothetical protein